MATGPTVRPVYQQPIRERAHGLGNRGHIVVTSYPLTHGANCPMVLARHSTLAEGRNGTEKTPKVNILIGLDTSEKNVLERRPCAQVWGRRRRCLKLETSQCGRSQFGRSKFEGPSISGQENQIRPPGARGTSPTSETFWNAEIRQHPKPFSLRIFMQSNNGPKVCMFMLFAAR